MPNAMETKTKKPGLTTKHIILILGSLAIVCAAVVAVVLALRTSEAAETKQATMDVINAANVEEIGSEIKDKVARGMFETHMNTTWTFPDGKSPSSDAVMGNAASNNYTFYFTVTLSDTGETVFTSGLMPVGTQISEIVLDKELSAGTYAALVGINMVDDDGEPVENNMGINITIVVEA